MKILYEDNHLLIVDKPAGLLTQPTEDNPESLETRCKAWIKETCQKPGNVYLHAVHRLDRPVSGIVVFARTSKALSRLNASMRSKNIEKHYLAWLEKTPKEKKGVLKHKILHEDHRASIDPWGKPASLSYCIKKTKGPLCLVEIKLDTGRYHQIRVQFSAIDCPILGDQKYGSYTPWKENAIALHHYKMQLTHPTTKELLTIESNVPDAWQLF